MKVNPEIVDILEQAMSDARSGRMSGVVVCGIHNGGCASGYFADGLDDADRLISVMSFVADRMWENSNNSNKESTVIPFPRPA